MKHKNEVSLGDQLEVEIRERIEQMFPPNKDKKECIGTNLQTTSQNFDIIDDNDSDDDADDDDEPGQENMDTEYIDIATESDQAHSQQTTCSNWSQEIKTSRDVFNDAMGTLSKGTYEPLRSQPSQPFQTLQNVTRHYYIRQATSAFQLICESIAPGQGDLLFQAVIDQNSKVKQKNSIQKDALTETVIEAYKAADDHNIRTQILSLIANKYSKAKLLKLIDDLSVHRIDKARKHASTHGPGHYLTPIKVTRVRISKAQIQHFIEFISAPCYLQTVGFGSKTLKLSSGVQVKVPKVIRTMIGSRLISAYSSYCHENSVQMPSRATLFKIIKSCSASQLKSLQGLDNYASEGMSAIDILLKTIDKLGENGLQQEKANELKKQLHTLKSHMKHYFQTHLTKNSCCIHHCIDYALSERTCDHEHDEVCVSCLNLYTTKQCIEKCLESVSFSDVQTKEEIEFDIKSSNDKLIHWCNHSIRSVNQDKCKSDILKNLKKEQVLIIADWAMKYLPQNYRETQSDWYGKQGISWHVICALFLRDQQTSDDNESEGNYDIRSFVHLVKNGNQGWYSVSQIFHHTFSLLKEMNLSLSKVFIKSDNAGCYHSLPLMAYLWTNRNNMCLKVKEFNFSEVQFGKDLCDARTGSCRLHILNYVNEGHNVTDVYEMKNALESHGGVVNTYVSIIDVKMEQQPSLSGQLRLYGISTFNNFVFKNAGLNVFKAYGIGTGEWISSGSLESISRNMTDMTEICGYEVKELPTCNAPDRRKSSRKTCSANMLLCTDPNCVKQFKKHNQLMNHIAKGDHLYDSDLNDTIEDKSKRLWAEAITTIRSQPIISSGTNLALEHSLQYHETAGYALKRRKQVIRFSSKVKEYVHKVFQDGEVSGKKANPYTVSKNIRYEVDENGKRLFLTTEWLSPQQVRGLFASFATRKHKPDKKRLKLEEVVDDNDEELQNCVNSLIAVERMDIVYSISNELVS